MPYKKYFICLSIFLTSFPALSLESRSEENFSSSPSKEAYELSQKTSENRATRSSELVKEVVAAYPSIDSARSILRAAMAVEIETSEGTMVVGDIVQEILKYHQATVQSGDPSSPITKIVLKAEEYYVDGLWTLALKLADTTSVEGHAIAELFLDGLKLTQGRISLQKIRLDAAKVKVMTNLLRSEQVKNSEEAYLQIKDAREDSLRLAAAEIDKMNLYPRPPKGAIRLSDKEGHSVDFVGGPAQAQVTVYSAKSGGGYSPRIVWRATIDQIPFELSSTGQLENIMIDGQEEKALTYSQANYNGIIPGLPGFSKKRNRLVSIRVNAKTGALISANIFQTSIFSLPGEELELKP
jgi:hypothetical protein